MTVRGAFPCQFSHKTDLRGACTRSSRGEIERCGTCAGRFWGLTVQHGACTGRIFAVREWINKRLLTMDDFAAIDFETANPYRSSVCSVGVVVVRAGRVTDSLYRLIRPEPNYYMSWNTRVHGLTEADTDSAPTFPEVWQEVVPLIGGLPLVAHNSPFDESCLRAAFKRYELEYPDYRFYCTCRAARRVFKQLPNHRLETVAAACGFDLTQHHHALADAEACAEIAIRIL